MKRLIMEDSRDNQITINELIYKISWKVIKTLYNQNEWRLIFYLNTAQIGYTLYITQL